MVGEKVGQLELMNLQKQLKSWELEKYYSIALTVMVRTLTSQGVFKLLFSTRFSAIKKQNNLGERVPP